LQRVERYDHKIIRVDVELYHERNPRQSGSCQRVEITCKSRGPVIRSEACAADFYSALDFSVGKLEGRLRRSADRRRVHHGMRTPTSVAAATSAIKTDETAPPEGLNGVNAAEGHLPTAVIEGLAQGEPLAGEAPTQREGDGPGRIVRVKEHPAKPMTIDQALFEMELVGHDFYLFADADTGQSSVVYRRKGYDYGVIRLTS
jgi:ribosomal subunit interface protein